MVSEMERAAAAESRKPLTNWKREVSILWSEKTPIKICQGYSREVVEEEDNKMPHQTL